VQQEQQEYEDGEFRGSTPGSFSTMGFLTTLILGIRVMGHVNETVASSESAQDVLLWVFRLFLYATLLCLSIVISSPYCGGKGVFWIRSRLPSALHCLLPKMR
jgi:hypothetical protein